MTCGHFGYMEMGGKNPVDRVSRPKGSPLRGRVGSSRWDVKFQVLFQSFSRAHLRKLVPHNFKQCLCLRFTWGVVFCAFQACIFQQNFRSTAFSCNGKEHNGQKRTSCKQDWKAAATKQRSEEILRRKQLSRSKKYTGSGNKETQIEQQGIFSDLVISTKYDLQNQDMARGGSRRNDG